MKVCSVSRMRELDRQAAAQFGIPEEILMENAGLALGAVIAGDMGVEGRRFVVLCGVGNNGGDGLVVARKLHSGGGRVRVFVLGDPSGFKGPARLNWEIARRLGLEIREPGDPAALARELADCDAIVDAIFGTGLAREVGGLHRGVIEAINASGKPVFSADIPSGVHGDTGQVMGAAVRAACTVAFGLPKPGNLLFPGFDLGGRLHVTHISFPPELYRAEDLQVAVNHPPPLPPRMPDGHKGSFGQALFVAGAAAYYGAPRFAALSFLKAGGGYSRLAAPASMIPFLAAQADEIVFLPQPETGSGSVALQSLAGLLELAERMDFVVIGPGLSLDGETQELVRRFTRAVSKPLLIDGDGLTAVSEDLDSLRRRSAPTILTPHPGEMAGLTNRPVSEIRADRIGILQRAARELNAVVVLKGAHSLIGLPDQRVFINLSGNSGMATAGSGDVLTGTIAAAYCLGLPAAEAVCLGVFLHGWAGDLAAAEMGADGITARDILQALPLALKLEREGAGRSRRCPRVI